MTGSKSPCWSTRNEAFIELQSRTKLLEKVFPIMSTILRNKLFPKGRLCIKKTPSPNSKSKVACYKGPGIRLSFKYTTTLLSWEGVQVRSMFREMLPKYAIFSTVCPRLQHQCDFQKRSDQDSIQNPSTYLCLKGDRVLEEEG